jgi:hypothetical protein
MSSPAQPVLPLERSALSPLTFVASLVLFLSLHGVVYTGHYLWSLRQPPTVFGWLFLLMYTVPLAAAAVVLLTGRFRTLLLIGVSLMLASSSYFVVRLINVVVTNWTTLSLTLGQTAPSIIKELLFLILVLSLFVLFLAWAPSRLPPTLPHGSNPNPDAVLLHYAAPNRGSIWRIVSLIVICLAPLLYTHATASIGLFEVFSSGTETLRHLVEAATVFLSLTYGLIAAAGLLLRPQPRLLWILIACVTPMVAFELIEVNRRYEVSVRVLPRVYAGTSERLSHFLWLARTPWLLLTSLLAMLLLAFRPPPWLSGRTN